MKSRIKIIISAIVLVCWFFPAGAQKIPLFKLVEKPDSKRIDVLVNDSLFTSLLYADSLKKHVLYPVVAANGAVVSRGWPIEPKQGDQIDHPHQIGVWFNNGDVNGADYWNNSTKIDTNKKAYGTIRVKEIKSLKSGKGQAEFTLVSVWYNPGGRAVLEEETRFTFRQDADVRVIERETKLKALINVLFKDNKEGLFGIRVSRQLEMPAEKPAAVYMDGQIRKVVDKEITTGMYESSSGVKGDAVFGTRSDWLKLSGKVDDRQATVVLIDHPKNPNYPGFWMARGYGLFAINPLGAHFYTNGKESLNFSLKQGQDVIFKHCILIGGDLSNARIQQVSHSFGRQ